MQNNLGKHVILDLTLDDPTVLSDLNALALLLVDAAWAAGATVLDSSYHHFGKGNGVSGICLLAESHISVHTWPERNYAAFDVFMCGDCDPMKSANYIIERMQPRDVKKNMIYRSDKY